MAKTTEKKVPDDQQKAIRKAMYEYCGENGFPSPEKFFAENVLFVTTKTMRDRFKFGNWSIEEVMRILGRTKSETLGWYFIGEIERLTK